MTAVPEPDNLEIPEWHLEEAPEAAEPYNFSNVNPRSVFVLALLAALLAVAIVLGTYLLIEAAIDADVIPPPPEVGRNAS